MLKRWLSIALACLPLGALAATPPQGVPLKVRRGFYTETNLGVFWTLGGDNHYSNAQPYLQLGVGYDLTERIAVGGHFGLGTNAVNCFAGFQGGTEDCRLADSFTLAFADVTASYRFKLAERFYFAPQLAAGYTRIDPAPVVSTPQDKATVAPNAGVGVGIEYATSMDHFSVGADLLARMVIGPNIPTFAFFPRVKYTF